MFYVVESMIFIFFRNHCLIHIKLRLFFLIVYQYNKYIMLNILTASLYIYFNFLTRDYCLAFGIIMP